jgi:RNA polymerase sigma factor (TIGR02999 family)
VRSSTEQEGGLPDPGEITVLIERVRVGDEDARAALVRIVYPELKVIAARLLAHERIGHTLATTELVHEAYLRLGLGGLEVNSRRQFFALAAHVMRHVLVDSARKRKAQKRGAGAQPVELIDALIISEDRLEEILELDKVLSRFEKVDPRCANIVTCRFYGGMEVDEIAAELKISSRTVKRELKYARAWLNAAMKAHSHVANA